VRRFKFLDALIDTFCMGNIPVCQETGYRIRRDTTIMNGRLHGRQGRAKNQAGAFKVIEERLLPGTVSAEKQTLLLAVPYCKSPHAPAMPGQIFPPLFVPIKQALCIGA